MVHPVTVNRLQELLKYQNSLIKTAMTTNQHTPIGKELALTALTEAQCVDTAVKIMTNQIKLV